jgi:hypothetical protein
MAGQLPNPQNLIWLIPAEEELQSNAIVRIAAQAGFTREMAKNPLKGQP